MRTIREEDEPGVSFEDARVKRCTARAALYDLGGLGEHWIPHSQVHDDSELYYDEDEADMNTSAPATLVVTDWIARQKGLV